MGGFFRKSNPDLILLMPFLVTEKPKQKSKKKDDENHLHDWEVRQLVENTRVAEIDILFFGFRYFDDDWSSDLLDFL